MNTHTAVAGVLSTVAGVDADKLGPEVALESIGLDSLALLEVALAVQKDLGVTVDDGDVAGARTVGDLVALVDDARARVA